MTDQTARAAYSDATVPAVLPLVGRIGIASIFVLSGLAKIGAPGAALAYIASSGLPFPELGLAIALFVELGVSAALVIGWRTRAAALVLAAFSVVTAFAFHNHLADQNQFIHFFKNIALAGGLLNVVAFGGGSLSLDARRR